MNDKLNNNWYAILCSTKIHQMFAWKKYLHYNAAKLSSRKGQNVCLKADPHVDQLAPWPGKGKQIEKGINCVMKMYTDEPSGQPAVLRMTTAWPQYMGQLTQAYVGYKYTYIIPPNTDIKHVYRWLFTRMPS